MYYVVDRIEYQKQTVLFSCKKNKILMTRNTLNNDSFKGWLYKWTNYLKGYQKRWFVLKNGSLSYYRCPEEVEHSCRGTINVTNAEIQTDLDPLSFILTNSGVQTFHLRASSEIERQKWVTKLELEKTNIFSAEESEGDDESIDDTGQIEKQEFDDSLTKLILKLDDMRTCRDVIRKNVSSLQNSLDDIETTEQITANIKVIHDRTTMFNVSSNALIKNCGDFLNIAQENKRRCDKLIKNEFEKRKRLEMMVEQLAKQQREFEHTTRKVLHDNGGLHSSKCEPDQSLSDESDNEFQDALEDHVDWQCISRLTDKQNTSINNINKLQSASISNNNLTDETNCWTKIILPEKLKSTRSRRSRIPNRPNYSLNLWSIMKNCIGKELTKIPMPVNFSEPLSFLQRLTEDFEYSKILDYAVKCKTSCEQLAYVTAFTISSYANTSGQRTGKPFNPLLGETFEADRREDYGWRSIAEQVCHHPPKCAMYTEGNGWRSWQEFTMSSKFRGKYLQIIPLGIAHLEFTDSGNHYTWRKVTTTVHNIIVGRLWVDNHGEMDIINHKNGDVCHIKYSPYSYFSRDKPRRVAAVVKDKLNVDKFVLRGFWDDYVEGAPIVDIKIGKNGKTIYETGENKILWKRKLYPELEKCYNMTKLAIELNEQEDGVAPTDSRNRPDQRAMEIADWETANQLKVQLEDKQRASRRQRENQNQETTENWTPCWFQLTKDPYTGMDIFMYNNQYWSCKEKQQWARCPSIYLSD